MNDVIRLLPDSVANQIAAGEVIQRPASVVKELVENAVDAGATQIKVILKDAGRNLIEVIDNGCGMSPTDARLSFDRHSTSKITEASDLFALRTMGFRGEALASICAVSEVELRTMRRDDSVGTRIVVAGSKVETQEPFGCAPGTCMMVKRLFFNVPARRKFLKSDNVEMSHVLREFERLALVNPGIEMELTHNDTLLHRLMKASFKQRIVDLFGKSLSSQLVPIESQTSLVKISGFVSRPENARRRGALQYFMVNGRNMKHPYFHKAVMMCYDRLIASDMQPSYFINFEVDPQSIDINIHPTKNEIKFENEQPIWQILTATVREGLGKFNAVPSIDFDRDDAPEIPAFNPDRNASPGLDLDASYNPFASSSPSSRGGGGVSPSWRNSVNDNARDWEKLYADFKREAPTVSAGPDIASVASSLNGGGAAEMTTQEESTALDTNSIMQLKGRYILMPSAAGLMLIDQHRAHIRILYEKYVEAAKGQAFASQRVMFPEVVSLSASENSVMQTIAPQLLQLGFEIDYLGDNSWCVNGMPSVMENVNPQELMVGMIATAMETGQELSAGIHSMVALAMARAAAIKPGQFLTQAEMNSLTSELLSLSTPTYTPDGKTVLAVITLDDISRLFS